MAAYPLFNVAWDANINQPVVICDDICLPWMMCSNEELAAQIPQEALDFTALYYSICHKIEKLEIGDTGCICNNCVGYPTQP